ncbi:hypothetical protein K450DRAFT_219378 [Umbelopsis ramanniana AG]|uniref:Uncharacterized protein n=1 Tax=Umbelopsis ramanniana AG TaxID=1314678 RepID=A0AAD5HHA1_UMBRA|nr:uncharacterized protein K450DRAFT_219378 [Umbelopsis ramanniana AG]KAI8584340.1 hypothetical protein K450DRAFT_219378 [Umbelopsis ramanniana AG]
MTNNANKKLLANCLVLSRQQPIAYTEDVSPLNAVDVRWFAPPTYANIVPTQPLEEPANVDSSRSMKIKRRISLSRGPSLRLKTLFAVPVPHHRRGFSDIAVHPMVPKEEMVVTEEEVEKGHEQRTPVEGKYFEELSTDDRFWLRNSTTHIYQQQSSAKDNWLVRKLSIPKRPLPSIPIGRIQKHLSLRRRVEAILAN